MDLIKAKTVLEILKGVDITEAGIFTAGEDSNQVRGISQDRMTIMFSDVERFIDYPVGILSVNGLLTRLNLFQDEKAGVELKKKDSRSGGEYVTQFVVKEGRRRSTVTTTDPAMMKEIPTKYPDSEPVFRAYFDTEYIDYINKMKTSIKTSVGSDTMYVEMSFDGNTAESRVDFNIGGGYDDFDDSVEAEVMEEFVGKQFSVQWKIEPFIRAMKQAATIIGEGVILVTVNSIGIVEIDIVGMTVSVVPINVSQPE